MLMTDCVDDHDRDRVKGKNDDRSGEDMPTCSSKSVSTRCRVNDDDGRDDDTSRVMTPKGWMSDSARGEWW